MKKQQKQFLAVLMVLLLFIAAYFLLTHYNKTKEAIESSEEEAAKIYVTDIQQEEITAFSYQLEDSTVTMVKDGDSWTYQEAPEEDMDETQVDAMAGYLNKIEAAQIVEDPEELSEYGFDEPTNVITMTTENGTVTLTIGMENSITSQYYLTSSENDKLYLVDTSLVSEFQRSPEELIAQEDTETEVPAENETDVENTEE